MCTCSRVSALGSGDSCIKTIREKKKKKELGCCLLQVSVYFFVSVVNSQVFTVYINIYIFSLYAYIHYYFCTDLLRDGFIFFFFHKRVLLYRRPSPTPFAWLCSKFLHCSVVSPPPLQYFMDCCYWSTVIL